MQGLKGNTVRGWCLMVLVLNNKFYMKKFYFVFVCILLVMNKPAFGHEAAPSATDLAIFDRPEIYFTELDKLEAAFRQNPDMDVRAYAAKVSNFHLNLNPNMLSGSGIKPFWIGCFFNVFGYAYVGMGDKYSTEEKWQSLYGCLVSGATCVTGVLVFVWR
jgi:hypothetical protein